MTDGGEGEGRDRAAVVLDDHPGLRERLRERYADPPRHYHSFEHAARVAATAAALGGDRACLLAAWFHDVVYDPGAADNEERSARLLLDWLDEDPDAGRAAELVRMTAEHRPDADDHQAAILSDADLAVLGGSPEQYDRYRRRVRDEYARVPDEQWRAGRGAVLRDLLSRRSLFSTAAARARWEDPARANLAAELAELERHGV